jgi:hypothetical protein
MKQILFLLLLTIPAIASAQSADHEKQALEALLHEFLEGASYNDAAIHDRFWADDLIYTGSNGNRITKADIMGGVTENPDRTAEPDTRYDGDQIQINIYGDTAVVAFRLIAIFSDNPEEERAYFYNTGTFVNRDGEWRAVAWQATRIPN